MPDTTRKYEVIWEKGIINSESGNFWSNFWQNYSNEKNNFAFGKYTAKLSVVAGTLDKAIITNNGATVSFWVLPWHIMLVWLVVAVLVVFVLVYIMEDAKQSGKGRFTFYEE